MVRCQQFSKMPLLQKISSILKAWRHLGRETIWLYAKYQLKLRSGWLRLQTPGGSKSDARGLEPRLILVPASKKDFEKLLGKRVQEILDQAGEILQGQVRLFGTEPRKLDLQTPGKLKHWTRYHSQLPDGGDIKPVWEMGRFGWATTLARAYWISGEEYYAEGFWRYFEEFTEANPPNLGPHWSSAQEVALRMIAFAFCFSLIADSKASNGARKEALGTAVISHVERIPPSIDYARAQNNNHLLSEAMGLVTAAALLPEHPKASGWKKLGWDLFNEGIEKQIHADGAYAQHSNNYHRLMLQLGIWARLIEKATGETMEQKIKNKLASTTDWLMTIIDEESGKVPNLGPNDGAYVLPLSVLSFEDYRPALQAASQALRGEPALATDIWDETAMWLGFKVEKAAKPTPQKQSPIRLVGKNSWAYFRTAVFKERPGHADQLHVDLWWRGLNVAQDAGSYLYTAPAPWDNALASARVHNTVTVNGQEPMTRAGRFLWLDWAQAKILSTSSAKDGKLIEAAAQHDGYRRLGVLHRREVNWNVNRWVVADHLLPTSDTEKAFRVRLHWLLPDWDWQIDTQEVRIESPQGEIEIALDVSVGDLADLKLFREGKLIHGSGEDEPILGWASPTYGIKIAALSFVADVQGPLPITMTSTWTFPGK